jgi:hypothetical protein
MQFLPTRRRLLGLAATGLAAAGAGCGGVLCRGVAGDVELDNDHDAAHSVRVAFEGPTSLSRSYDLAPGERRSDEDVLLTDGEYAVRVAVDGEGVAAGDDAVVSYESGSGCRRGEAVSISIREDGSASVSVFHAD